MFSIRVQRALFHRPIASELNGIRMTSVSKSPLTLSVVIVNTSHHDLLKQCLQALRRALLPDGTEIIVVDNASVDESVAMVEQEFPEVKLIRKTSRRGPAHNYNSGFAVARGEFILVLNEDAEVTATALGVLLQYLQQHPRVGIAAPKLVYPDGRDQRCCSRFPDFGFVLKRLFLQAFVHGPWVDHAYSEESANRTFHPDWIMATCLMIRREAMDQVGQYDEQFEVYYEETDLARRLENAGWSVAWIPEAVVKHHHGVSNFQLRSDRDILFRQLLYQSRYRYFKKHSGLGYERCVRGIESVAFAIFMAKNRLEALMPARRQPALMKAKLYRALCHYAATGRGVFAVPPVDGVASPMRSSVGDPCECKSNLVPSEALDIR